MMVIKQDRESLSSEKGKGGVIDSNVDCTMFYMVEENFYQDLPGRRKVPYGGPPTLGARHCSS